jgi:aryl-alcohol dehydrogenase-like predicted oxidoreductase
MIKHAYDLGVNFIDTANVYAHGTSEIYIGNALKELNIPRDKIVIASKVFHNDGQPILLYQLMILLTRQLFLFVHHLHLISVKVVNY